MIAVRVALVVDAQGQARGVGIEGAVAADAPLDQRMRLAAYLARA